MLGLSSLGSTCFFLARLGIDAPGFGRHDAGLALALAFASVLLTWACAALAALSGILLLVSWARRRPGRLYLWAFLAATLPIVYLALR